MAFSKQSSQVDEKKQRPHAFCIGLYNFTSLSHAKLNSMFYIYDQTCMPQIYVGYSPQSHFELSWSRIPYYLLCSTGSVQPPWHLPDSACLLQGSAFLQTRPFRKCIIIEVGACILQPYTIMHLFDHFFTQNANISYFKILWITTLHKMQGGSTLSDWGQLTNSYIPSLTTLSTVCSSKTSERSQFPYTNCPEQTYHLPRCCW